MQRSISVSKDNVLHTSQVRVYSSYIVYFYTATSSYCYVQKDLFLCVWTEMSKYRMESSLFLTDDRSRQID